MAKYAYIENDKIEGVYDDLPTNWKNISNFHALIDNFDYLETLGWRQIQLQPDPSFNPYVEYLSDSLYRLENDQVLEYKTVVTREIIAFTPEVFTIEQQAIAKADRHNNTILEMRTKRDLLLRETDYTQLPDMIALNGEALTLQFVEYRQTLRDLPGLYEDDPEIISIDMILFPELPTKL